MCNIEIMKKDEILKYISKYNPSDNNWYRLINGDNVNHKGSLIGKIVNINDQSNIKYEYLYKLTSNRN